MKTEPLVADSARSIALAHELALREDRSRALGFPPEENTLGSVKLQTVCVYCGSSPGRRAAYLDAARELAVVLVERGIGLVYGGGRIGLMGAIADAVLEAGGHVTGVIPRALASKEVAHDALSELIVTESMHARKTLMADRADAFVALPGGIGTLEELFEVWTWSQLGFHEKPCGVLNVEGYFDALIGFIDQAVDEQFLRPAHREILFVDRHPRALLDRLSAYEPPNIPKWIGPGGT